MGHGPRSRFGARPLVGCNAMRFAVGPYCMAFSTSAGNSKPSTSESKSSRICQDVVECVEIYYKGFYKC